MTADPITADRWATIKRVLPRDVYDQIKYFEQLIAEHSGLPREFAGIGDSVSVWSILVTHLRETEQELIQTAKDWKED